MDEDDTVNIILPINLRILNDIGKTYHHQGRHTNIVIRHKDEHIKDLHVFKEEIHSLERLYHVTFSFTPELR